MLWGVWPCSPSKGRNLAQVFAWRTGVFCLSVQCRPFLRRTDARLQLLTAAGPAAVSPLSFPALRTAAGGLVLSV